MPSASVTSKSRGQAGASPEQTALYTYDMLTSLKRLADLNKQSRLALLIEQAAEEAQSLCRTKK
jgi:hypothetical protein